MTVTEVAEALELDIETGQENLDRSITGGCVSDLLSYVMGSAAAGNLWITIQVHPNIVGVAELLDLAGIVIADGQELDTPTIEKARQHGIPLLASKETAFTLAGRLYALGVT